jgi:hypothetical protein
MKRKYRNRLHSRKSQATKGSGGNGPPRVTTNTTTTATPTPVSAESNTTRAWASNMIVTFAQLASFVPDRNPVLELELRRPVTSTSEWNVLCGRHYVLHGVHAHNITGSRFNVLRREVQHGWEYNMGEHRLRHWDDSDWCGMVQKKIAVSELRCSTGKIYASVETDSVLNVYDQEHCESHVPRVRITRTLSVLGITGGWDAPHIRVIMTERSCVQMWMEGLTHRDIEVELVVDGNQLELQENGSVDMNTDNWHLYVECLLSVWRWFADGIIGTMGMTACAADRREVVEVGPFPLVNNVTSLHNPAVPTPVDGRVVVAARGALLPSDCNYRGLVSGIPFTIIYDGDNSMGRGSVWLRRNCNNVTMVTELKSFLVDDNSVPTSTEVPSALVSSKRLRYTARSGTRSAFIVQGVIVTGVFIVTGVTPASMLATVKRSWPRTFAVHFLDVSSPTYRFGWQQVKVRWDVVRRIHLKMTHTLLVTTLVPLLVIGRVSEDAGKVVLGEDEVHVVASVCMDLSLPDQPVLLCLSARTSDDINVVVMVTMGYPMTVLSVVSQRRFRRMVRTTNMLVGHSWLLYNRRECTFRHRTDTSYPLTTMFSRLDTYEQLLWIWCELGDESLRVDATVHSNGWCYANPGSRKPSNYLVRVAQAPLAGARYTPGVYQVHLTPRSEFKGHAMHEDHTERCTGSLECVSISVAVAALDTQTIKLRPVVLSRDWQYPDVISTHK